MTPSKQPQKLSPEEFRRLMARHGAEPMSEEERQSGVTMLTFITRKERPAVDDDTTSDDV